MTDQDKPEELSTVDILSEAEKDQKAEGALVDYKEVMPSVLHVVPVTQRPLFPGQAVPLVVDAELWEETFKIIVDGSNPIVGLVLAHADSLEEALPETFYEIGTACRIHRVSESDQRLQVIVEGVQRFRIDSWISRERPFKVRPHYFPEMKIKDNQEYKPYILAIINTIKELLPLNPLYSEELKIFMERYKPEDPSPLADFAASLTSSSREELQEILESIHLITRLDKVLALLNKELQTAKAQAQILKQVEEKMQDQQRDFFLREQLKAIQKELGIEKDDRTAEMEKFDERLESLVVPEEAQKRIDEEMEKLSVLETGSPEYAVTRNYLDWLTLLPWGVYSKDKLNLPKARKQLDKDHEGLEDVKDRIIEFLAVGKLKGKVSGIILLLVGPPGVGKTSIGRSIANALGRKFFRFSVGGIHDEAEIKGHRRTYIGAMPGKFIQAMKEVATSNPVIMLDEIDKIGASYRGDPASALLEVLDPEQNTDFLDHYLDVRFDLSKVLFIGTANQLDTIPSPLLDRMEMIQLSGYLSAEKLKIAKRHLIARQLERNGLKRTQLTITDAALSRIIEGYAREAGVRNLEKRIGTLARKAAIAVVEEKPLPVKISIKNLHEYLGKPLFENEQPLSGVGVITGLAWTPMGGATLSVEASRVHSYNRGFKLTGQLGDVMKESAEIAYSYLVSQRALFDIDPLFFEEGFLHLHVPAGATPKDGPSAGITIVSALLSLANQWPVTRPLAMTGEITLTGQVLPVGGIREKVIAARRVDIFELILPDANRRDFEELPEHVREGVSVHFVKEYPQVAPLIWGSPLPQTPPKKTKPTTSQ